MSYSPTILPQRGKINRNGSTGGPNLTTTGTEEPNGTWKVSVAPTTRDLELDYVEILEEIARIPEKEARAVRKMVIPPTATNRSEDHIG